MKIVIGYDGSEAAKRALERVAEFAGGGEVSVVSAVHVLPQFGRAPLTIDPEEIAERKSELREAAEILPTKGIQPSLVEGHGEPADVIVEKAEELGAGLIVVGTNGQNAAKRVLLGSVSSSVLHKAHCDVLVVR
jgi:nucleotide-binding universal stress UspA family protein